MKIAFMFPGQGSQYVGMGKTLFDFNPLAKEMFLQADKILGFELSALMFSGSEEKLKRTENTQPAILIHSIALFKVLQEKIKITNYSVVGHSLGEYSAYVASNRLSYTDAVHLVRKRGLFMSEVSSELYGMAAVLKLQDTDIDLILKQSGNNEVFIANDNCPGQIVISGLKSRIQEITPLLQEKGGRLIPLAVSGAFHSLYMKDAAIKLEQELNSVVFKDSLMPLYSNINAQELVYGKEKESLVEQVYKGVLFTQSIKNMIANGIDIFIEVGPGKVLQGLVKKNNANVKVLGIETLEDIENITKELL